MRPILMPLAGAIALSLTMPAAAQTAPGTATGMANGADRPMVAPGSPARPVGVCERNNNLLNIMIEPWVHAIPIWIRPFTGKDDTPAEILALYDRCAQEVAVAEPLVSWTASGPGLKPIGDQDQLIPQRPDRPRLEDQGRQ